MGFDLFKKENEVIKQTQSILEQDETILSPQAREEFTALLSEYQKLFKNSKRLIKLSDRNEKKLRDASHEIVAQKQELERRQKELVQAEKLASLGQLVAGVAHELNTPLGIILTASSSLREETVRFKTMMTEGKVKKSDLNLYLESANEISTLLEHHSDVASDLITSFKAISVDQAIEDLRKFELVEYVTGVVRSLSPSLKTNKVQVIIEPSNAIEISCYPGPLSQVLTNLILNAHKHGFDEGKIEGVIRISLLKLEKSIQIIVSDTGKGIEADFIGQIFDPFVTTARTTGGTGLGLHIVHNIVTGKLKGQIAVESKVQSGSRFIITIPVIKETEGHVK